MKHNYFLLLTLLITSFSFSQSPGDIIITEIMIDPSQVTDANGEWFEVYNTTTSAIDMNGWTIKDLGSNSHTISATLSVPAGGGLLYWLELLLLLMVVLLQIILFLEALVSLMEMMKLY